MSSYAAYEEGIQNNNNNISKCVYDPDIFVMSNTTFDEDMASISSRRVSAGKQPYQKEFLNFVDTSADIKKFGPSMSHDSSQLNKITSQLFIH